MRRSEDDPEAVTFDGAEASESMGSNGESPEASPGPATPPPAVGRLLLVVVTVCAAMTLSLQPGFRGGRAPWFIMTAAYAGLTLLAAFELSKRGQLVERLRIRPGDASVGIVLGLALCAGGWLGQRSLSTPGSVGEQWLGAVHGLGGSFQTDGVSIFLLFLVCAGEETVWRGMVQDELAEWRPRAAPILTTLLYALSTLPSVFLLGPGETNPLLLLAALGAGLVWSHGRRILPRLFPLIVSHLVFTYFMAAPLPSWVLPGG
jgi:membrane protease YdiL (CAAX protease family)